MCRALVYSERTAVMWVTRSVGMGGLGGWGARDSDGGSLARVGRAIQPGWGRPVFVVIELPPPPAYP